MTSPRYDTADGPAIEASEIAHRVTHAAEQLASALETAMKWDATMTPATGVDPDAVLQGIQGRVAAERGFWDGIPTSEPF
ncbi:MAG: hypothetical protein WBN89_16690 [Prochlorococcaceae cyanobacterium]